MITEYLKETPEKLKLIIENSRDLFAEVKKQDINRIIITGSGTSYHSGAQVQQKMREISGISVEAYYPFLITKELLASDANHTLFVGISQGGSSYSTYNVMKMAKDLGCKVASMAGAENALIDEPSDYILTVLCGEEKAGAKTKGFYSTKLNLLLLALSIGQENGTLTQDEYNEIIETLKNTADHFLNVYYSAETWVNNNADRLKHAKEIRIIGTKELYGDTLESALKLLETMRVPVTGYEFEEFIHGIYNAVNEDSTIIVLNPSNDPRIEKLINVLSEWTNNIYVIGTKVEGLEEEKNFVIESGDNYLYNSFVYPIAIQLICAIIPKLKGIDPSRPKDPQFHMKLESKKLNR
ncbi:SIS domain-containing protein [Terrilactibacillus laevilacticus]|uniref:SIS domain-containing protein n=1 Tax=Terrilactibacillus laevilacticus TaxID=1380157 RepID=UPI0011465A0E|nr:SIS domain-containing protein [Terrilactibacillus laevilacticus]